MPGVYYSNMYWFCWCVYYMLLCGGATAKHCQVDGLSAVCTTDVEAEQIVSQPPQLSPNLTKLHINHIGKPTELLPPLLDEQPYLTEIKISGNIYKIGKGLFDNQRFLTTLHITKTHITSLPEDLLKTQSYLDQLSLESNRLEDIPLPLFHHIPRLQKLNVANNCITRKNCSLGDEFKHLRNLTDLDLGGLTVTACKWSPHVQHGIFDPINTNLLKLNLTATSGIVRSDHPLVFKHFLSLESLDLSNIRTLGRCPRDDIPQIFYNLPKHTISSLGLRYLRSPYDISYKGSCFITVKDMEPLRQMPRLKKLDFSHSDMIFGSNISNHLFSGLHNLEELDLRYCRISVFTTFAFNDLPNLKKLNVDGNPLGSRLTYFQRLRNRSIQELSMRDCGMSTAGTVKFQPVTLLLNSGVSKIDLSSNILSYNPLFIIKSGDKIVMNEDHCETAETPVMSSTVRSSSKLESIALDHNHITSFRGLVSEELDPPDYCSRLQNLKNISLAYNNLSDIRGLCESVTNLLLNNNRLGTNWKHNSLVITNLHMIETLDLSVNEISSLSADLFAQMTILRKLYLSFNRISEIPDGLLKRCAKLEVLDLSNNRLLHFDQNVIMHYSVLEVLKLNDNRIGELSEELLQALEEGVKKQLTFDGNSVKCECTVPHLKHWLLADSTTRNVMIHNTRKVFCHSKNSATPLVEYEPNFTTCHIIEPLKYTGVALACLSIAFLIAWPCYKYRWYIEHPKIVLYSVINGIKTARTEYECVFDAYVAYDHNSTADCDFVAEVLQPALEMPNGDTNHDKQVRKIATSLGRLPLV